LGAIKAVGRTIQGKKYGNRSDHRPMPVLRERDARGESGKIPAKKEAKNK